MCPRNTGWFKNEFFQEHLLFFPLLKVVRNVATLILDVANALKVDLLKSVPYFRDLFNYITRGRLSLSSRSLHYDLPGVLYIHVNIYMHVRTHIYIIRISLRILYMQKLIVES